MSGNIARFFNPCLLTQLDDVVIDQPRLSQPCGHQDHRTFTGFRQLQQRIRIPDLDIVGAEAFLVQLLPGKGNDFIQLRSPAASLPATALSTLYRPGAILRCSAVR